MPTSEHDIIVVGGGTAGCFAAATAAREGLDVVLIERKSEEQAGHIACGDAIKGKSTFPDVIDLDYLKEEAFTNQNIQRAVFENPVDGEAIDIPFESVTGAVVDRKRYGEVLLEEADRLGTELHFNTVVQTVTQTDDGRVTGVKAKRGGRTIDYQAELVVDSAGSLSLLQDKTDFDGTTFDTNVNYKQFCSAYREVVEVPEPVEWDDAIVFKPTEELGYLWYFPRSETEINAGLGFQMNKEPMELVDVLRRDLENRREFQGAEVKDKLGAALPTRRPYDSAVAPGYVAVGDAAAHVNPTTGGGIPGAAKGGTWAVQAAMESLSEDGPTEEGLWQYNHDVMTSFGKRFAAMDLYNIFGSAQDVDELIRVVSSIPSQQLVDAMGRGGTTSMDLRLKLKTLIDTFGHWGVLYDLYQVRQKATELKELYEDYPTSPQGFGRWQSRRDSLMDEVYSITGAEPKY